MLLYCAGARARARAICSCHAHVARAELPTQLRSQHGGVRARQLVRVCLVKSSFFALVLFRFLLRLQRRRHQGVIRERERSVAEQLVVVATAAVVIVHETQAASCAPLQPLCEGQRAVTVAVAVADGQNVVDQMVASSREICENQTTSTGKFLPQFQFR